MPISKPNSLDFWSKFKTLRAVLNLFDAILMRDAILIDHTKKELNTLPLPNFGIVFKGL
jgi:hypothetical protein